MSIHDQAAAAVLSQVAMAADGALIGLALAYVSVRSILKYKATSSALHKINDAPSLSVSDLRSLVNVDSESNANSECSNQLDVGKIVIVRGTVEAKSAVEGNWKSLRGNLVSAHNSAEKGVILQHTQTCIYNEWRCFLGWTGELYSIFPRLRKDQESSSLRTVPFVLVETGRWPQPEYVNVIMDGSRHPLPLVTVYHHLQPVNATPLTFLQALFGHQYPVGVLDEEKILPVGKDITAVGVCSSKDGIFEIKSCKGLPYFLSDMTKDQMLVDLAFKTKVLLWSGVVLGSVAVGVLGYAVVRNWNRWKQWRHQRQAQQQRDSASSDAGSQVTADEETGDVPDGQLCVICLARRKRSAFIPCGHLVLSLSDVPMVVALQIDGPLMIDGSTPLAMLAIKHHEKLQYQECVGFEMNYVSQEFGVLRSLQCCWVCGIRTVSLKLTSEFLKNFGFVEEKLLPPAEAKDSEVDHEVER